MKHLLFLLALIPMIGMGQMQHAIAKQFGSNNCDTSLFIEVKKPNKNLPSLWDVQERDSKIIVFLKDSQKIPDHIYFVRQGKWLGDDSVFCSNVWPHVCDTKEANAFEDALPSLTYRPDDIEEVYSGALKNAEADNLFRKALKESGFWMGEGIDTISPRRSSPEDHFWQGDVDTSFFRPVENWNHDFKVHYPTTCNHKWVALEEPVIGAVDLADLKKLICILCHAEVTQTRIKQHIPDTFNLFVPDRPGFVPVMNLGTSSDNDTVIYWHGSGHWKKLKGTRKHAPLSHNDSVRIFARDRLIRLEKDPMMVKRKKELFQKLGVKKKDEP